ncbi:NACHT domain-containing protein [Enterovirga sp.]|uniref:NACHT domain-containing protein n=1 Tax=Enterovirga sp. TaxID=2026350 RepID=UPI002BC57C83|nr:NACHT domain-containing protein [Enterovirga sp.]HMO29382.1 NACHT domain-containing protein [Enterovirga sp.]
MAVNEAQKSRVLGRLKHIIEAYDDSYFLIVLGAGVSAAATASATTGPHKCSTWAGLVKHALQHLLSDQATPGLAQDLHLMVRLRGALATLEAGSFTASALTEFADWVIEGFDKQSPTVKGSEYCLQWINQTISLLTVVDPTIFESIGHLIDGLGPRRVILATTNYDRLAADHFQREPICLKDDTPSLPSLIADPRRYVVHLHGRYDWRGESIFSKTQYTNLCKRNAQAGSEAAMLFQRCVPILIGCGEGLFDEDISPLLAARVRSSQRHDLDALAIVDWTVHGPRPAPYGCGLYLFGESYPDLPCFIASVAEQLPAQQRNDKSNLRCYVEDILHLQANVRIPPVRVKERRLTEIPLVGFFGSVHREPVPQIEMLAGASSVARSQLDPFARGGEAAALSGQPGGPKVASTAPLEEPFSLILGDPGSGKTSLVRLLVREAAEQFLTEEKTGGGRLPLVIQISEFHRSRGPDGERGSFQTRLRDNLCAAIPEWKNDPAKATAVLTDLARSGRLLIVLDGLDEVSDPSDRQVIVAEAERLAHWLRASEADSFLSGLDLHQQSDEVQRWRELWSSRTGPLQNRILVTSRVSGYLNAPITSEDLRVFALGRMDEPQLLAFFKSFFDTATLANPDLADIFAHIAVRLPEEFEASQLRDLKTTPLLAAMIIGVFCADNALPRDEIGLFERVSELSCDHAAELMAADETLAPPPDRGFVMEALGRAAFHVFDTDLNGDLISLHDLERSIGEMAPAGVGDRALFARQVSGAIANDFGLLQQKTQQLFGFVHRGLQEYLCGRHVAHLPLRSDAIIGGLARRPGSTQPVRFAVILRLKDRGRSAAPLAREMQRVSANYNGARPWVLFLEALGEADDLSCDLVATVAELHLDFVSRLAPLLERPQAHPPLRRALVKLTQKPSFNPAFNAVIANGLRQAREDRSRARAAAAVCEAMDLTDVAVLGALADAWQWAASDAAYIRAILRRRVTAVSVTQEASR